MFSGSPPAALTTVTTFASALIELLDEVVADDLLLFIPGNLSRDKEQFALRICKQTMRVTTRRAERIGIDKSESHCEERLSDPTFIRVNLWLVFYRSLSSREASCPARFPLGSRPPIGPPDILPSLSRITIDGSWSTPNFFETAPS